MPSDTFDPLEHGAIPVQSTSTHQEDAGFDPVALGATPVSSANPFSPVPSTGFDPVSMGAIPVGNPTAPTQQPEQPQSGWSFANKVHDIWDSNEGTLGKVWDTVNTPLLGKSDVREGNRSGIVGGLEDFVSGLTSPLTAALTIATLGTGPLLESLGIDTAKMAAPEVMKAAKTVGKLAAAGFTVQQLKGVVDTAPQMEQAIRNGDTQKALEIGTGMVLNTATGLLGAKHAASEFGLFGDPKITPAETLVNEWKKSQDVAAIKAQNFVKQFRKDVPEQNTRNAIQFYTEAGGDADTIAKWRDEISSSDAVKPKLKAQVLAALDKARNLNDAEKAKSQELRELYDAHFEHAASKGVLQTGTYKNNFISRAPWAHEPSLEDANEANAKDILGDNSQDHTQKRIFDTTVDGLLKGYEPVYDGKRYVMDAADTAGDYTKSIARAIGKKDFVESALHTLATDGRPLAVPGGVLTKYDETTLDENGNRVKTGKQKLMLNGEAIPDHPLTKSEYRDLVRAGRFDSMKESGALIDKGALLEEPDETQPSAQSADGSLADHKVIANGTEVQYLPVTDEMRDSVLKQGQPLFNLGKPVKSELMHDGEEMSLTNSEDGRNVVNLGPGALKWVLAADNKEAVDRGLVLNGANVSRDGAKYLVKGLDKVLKKTKGDAFFHQEGHAADVTKLRDLIQDAIDSSGKEGVTFLGHESYLGDKYSKIKGEEFSHGDQRTLTGKDDDVLKSHLSAKAFEELAKHIPKAVTDYLDKSEYDNDAQMRVVEASAKLMGGQIEEMGVSEEEAAPFLKKYFDALVDKWGKDALKQLKSAVGVAARIRDERIAEYAAEEGLPKRVPSPEVLRGLPEGRGSRNQTSDAGAEDQRGQGSGTDSQSGSGTGRGGDGQPLDEVEESEYSPGDKLPESVSKPEVPIEDHLSKLPEHIQAAVKVLKDKVAEHQQLIANATDEDKEAAEKSEHGVQDARDTVEDMIEDTSRLPNGVRKATLSYLKQIAPDEMDKAEASYYRGRYRYNTEGYDNSIRHRYAWKTVYGGNPDIGLRAPVAFHQELAKRAKMILAPEKSWLQKNQFTNKILGISTAAKNTLLNLSGFHWGQIGLRGVESGVNPIKQFMELVKGVGGFDPNNPEHLKLIRGGLQLGNDGGANAFSEGLAGHGPLSKIPGLGPVIDSTNNALFGLNGFIDRMKLNAASNFAERLAKIKPELDERTRYKVASELANQRFGGLNYLAMGRSQTARDIARLLLLAPDWMESNLRDALSTLGPFGKLTRFDLARIALYNFAAAQTLNLLNTGKMHPENPFGVVSKDGKKVFSVRTMPSDIYHALTAPMDYTSNRLNPVLSRTAVEALTGRDRRGHLRSLGDQIKDLVENVTPIPLQGVTNAVTGNIHFGEDPSDYVRSAAGLTTRSDFTPAQSLAFKLASDNSGTGETTPEQRHRINQIVGLEDRLRQGDETAKTDLLQKVRDGEMAPSDVRQVITAARHTRLQAVVNRLPMADAIRVWNLATNDERADLMPVMAKKMASFRRTEAQKLTPSESDQMNLQLAKVFNDMEQENRQ